MNACLYKTVAVKKEIETLQETSVAAFILHIGDYRFLLQTISICCMLGIIKLGL